MTRTLPSGLAPVVEELELDGAEVVTTAELIALVKRAGLRTDPYVVVSRLADHGWLLPSGVKGVWEFAPAAHAGPIGHGDPFLVLRAQLAATPDLDARIGLESALWRHGIIDRSPERHVITVPTRLRPPVALLRTFDVAAFDAVVGATPINRLPVEAPATVLVHLAHRPTDVKNWGLVLDGLRALIDAAGVDGIVEEATGRPNATLVRLAYLTAPFNPRIASALRPASTGTVWFGARGPLRRHHALWSIADTVLPRSPSEVAAGA